MLGSVNEVGIDLLVVASIELQTNSQDKGQWVVTVTNTHEGVHGLVSQ